ncbi:MAG: S26 family signal peptidase [Gammaproteobacteria bacterium]
MKERYFGIVIVCIAGMISTIVTVGYHAGLRLNLTDSAPHGLWYVHILTTMTTIKRGELVEVCPPASSIVRLMAEQGHLSSGNCKDTKTTPLLKPISAIAGDVVQFKAGQPVTVNGITLPNTAAKKNIPCWAAGKYVVQAGEVWLFSSYSPNSFDSRYFGPVALSSVRGVARAIAVNGNVAAITAGVIEQ